MVNKKFIIIGGGFAGAYIAKKLEKEQGYEITLIDTKDYYEFTPGILRTIIFPQHAKKIQVLHSHYLKKGKIIIGEVKEVGRKEVLVEFRDGRNRKDGKKGNKLKKINFDYLIISSGSKYNFPFKEANVIMPTRAHELRNCHEELKKAGKILIIGGGIVGVELAGEIVNFYKGENKKDITIIHSHNKLMERQNEKARNYAEKYLKENNVKIIFNERVIGTCYDKKNCFMTDKKTEIDYDMAFLCTGIKPNFEFMKKNFLKALNEKNQVIVNNYLQINGFSNIFAAGDITSIAEEKTAQNAQDQAEIVVKNLINIEREENLIEYKSKPRIMVISLGKFNGILTYKNFALTGIFPGILKTLIEMKNMSRYK